MNDIIIRSRDDLAAAVGRMGILPFFRCGIPGWSVEEMADPSVWFTGGEGPWEWKGPLAADRICVYGKFLRGRAAFLTPEWFARLACSRRRGYEWETLLEEGLMPRSERLILEYLRDHPMTMSRRVRRDIGIDKGYDAALSRLQMQTWVVIADFQYSVSRTGAPYGWGNAVVELADRWLGGEFTSLSGGDPEAALDAIADHVMSIVPHAGEKAVRRELAP